MKSSLCIGEIFHERYLPGVHRFVYPIYHLGIDLDEFEKGELTRIFARDRFGLIAIRSGDYLRNKSGSLREKVRATLKDAGIETDSDSIELVTMPRVLGYVFNPVSFYFCRRADQTLHALIVEVSNTFGEKHIYVLNGDHGPVFDFPKTFYVSPFFDVSGEYRLTLGGIDNGDVSVAVELFKNGEKTFIASLQESKRPLTKGSLLRAVTGMPFSVLLAMVRIHLHAFLIFLKKAAFLNGWKQSEHKATIWSRQTMVHRARLGLLNLFRSLERIYTSGR